MDLGAFEFLPQADINHQAHLEPQVGIGEQIQGNVLQGHPEAAVGNLFIIQNEVPPHLMELPPANFVPQVPVNVHNQVLLQPARFVQASTNPNGPKCTRSTRAACSWRFCIRGAYYLQLMVGSWRSDIH